MEVNAHLHVVDLHHHMPIWGGGVGCEVHASWGGGGEVVETI